MFGLKTKIKVSEMSTVLYNYTVNPEYLINTVESLDKEKVLDRNEIKLEIIILIVVIVDYLLRSEKIHRLFGEKSNDLFINYLSLFKEETESVDMDSIFIGLLNERGNIYNAVLHEKVQLNPSVTSFEIGELFSKNVGVQNQPLFIMKVSQIFSSNLKILGELLDKFKLV